MAKNSRHFLPLEFPQKALLIGIQFFAFFVVVLLTDCTDVIGNTLGGIRLHQPFGESTKIKIHWFVFSIKTVCKDTELEIEVVPVYKNIRAHNRPSISHMKTAVAPKRDGQWG